MAKKNILRYITELLDFGWIGSVSLLDLWEIKLYETISHWKRDFIIEKQSPR